MATAIYNIANILYDTLTDVNLAFTHLAQVKLILNAEQPWSLIFFTAATDLFFPFPWRLSSTIVQNWTLRLMLTFCGAVPMKIMHSLLEIILQEVQFSTFLRRPHTSKAV